MARLTRQEEALTEAEKDLENRARFVQLNAFIIVVISLKKLYNAIVAK